MKKAIYSKRNMRALMVGTMCIGIAVNTAAQSNDQKKEETLSREMTLEKEYDPSLGDASKVNSLPEIIEIEVRKTPITYSNFVLPLHPQRELFVLGSGNLMTEVPKSSKIGYLNFGIGNYMNINGDLGVHILDNESDKLNIFYSNRTTNGKVKYLQQDIKQKIKLNDNIGGINYSHNFEPMRLMLGGHYGYSAFNYYGYPADESLTPETIDQDKYDRDTNQANQQVRAYVGVKSNGEPALNYEAMLEYNMLSHKYSFSPEDKGVKENAVAATLDLNKDFDSNKLIGLNTHVHYFNYSLPKLEGKEFFNFENHADVTLNPYFGIEGGDWKLRLGAKAVIITGKNSAFVASPDIKFDYTFAGTSQFYIDLDGGNEENSMYEDAKINRYASPVEGLKDSRTFLDGTFGIRSNVNGAFWLNAFGGYQITNDQHYFVPAVEEAWGNVGNAVYMNTKIFKVGAHLRYSYQDMITASVKGTYYGYSLDKFKWGIPTETAPAPEDLKPFNKPNFELEAGLTVKPINKLSLMLNYYLGSGRYALVNEETVKMNSINELNFTGTYSINSTIGVYVQLNNLLFQKYDLYWGYPAQKFAAMGGVNVNF